MYAHTKTHECNPTGTLLHIQRVNPDHEAEVRTVKRALTQRVGVCCKTRLTDLDDVSELIGILRKINLEQKSC